MLNETRAIPVAVGSGTINDIVKLAAHRSGRRYLCVPTAASMDGYTAFGASITREGWKQNLDCPAPLAILADPEILAHAPPEMSAWGYADLAAKITAGADWLVADALGVDPIEPEAWDLVQGALRNALEDPAAVRQLVPGAISALFEGLLLSGLAMQITRTSRPASGAEHQFSHLWDMQTSAHNNPAPSHGFKVAIGTLASTALYEALLRRPLERLDLDRACDRWPDTASAWERLALALFGPTRLGELAAREVVAKHLPRAELRKQLLLLREIWADLRRRLQEQLLPLAQLKSQFSVAGAPTRPEEIGISPGRLRESFLQAWFIRRRFTVLDLAMRAGLLEECLEEMFTPNGALS